MRKLYQQRHYVSSKIKSHGNLRNYRCYRTDSYDGSSMVFASIFLKGVFCNECPYKDQCSTHQSEEDFIPPCKQNANIDQFHINSNLL